jgi:hypothetical protein
MKDKSVQIRIDEELYLELKKECSKNERTISSEIRYIIKEYYDKKRKNT